MRKIILGYVLFFIALFFLFFGNKLYLLESSSEYKSSTGITYPAKTQGKDFLVYDRHSGWTKMFVTGVNIGTAKPGSYPGEFAITKEEYLRWFQYISDMHANTIRVYTLQMPEFYEALKEFNTTSENPLYLMHGVYLNEADIAQYEDAYAQNGKIINDFSADIKNAVDIIHGRAEIKKMPGLAGGSYTADVSGYVLGWILGIEWNPTFVTCTNQNNPQRTGYDGKFVRTADASPFETFLAETADLAISYETERYREQRPVALCNWVTTDPLKHPNEPNPNEDAVSVDVEHILPKDNFEAGFFASYHIYPYYPDFFSYETKYLKDGKANTYRAYLKELNAHHSMPLLVAEVGIPASRGITHENTVSGYNQGHISEVQQGQILSSLIGDIRSEQCMGGLIFSWQDEWFKTTWNTMDLDIPDRRAYWMDYQTNEQNFGLLSFDPGNKATAVNVDGDISEWGDADRIAENGSYRLYAKSDEKLLYLMAEVNDFANETVYIPIDTVPGQGNRTYNGAKFNKGADFLVMLSGKENSTVLVDPYYDPTYYQYAVKLGMMKQNPGRNSTDTGRFTRIRQVLSQELKLPETGTIIPFRTVDSGKLHYGNANPASGDYDSLADFCERDGHVELRIPWLMLNVMDPSSKNVIGDMYRNTGITPQEVDSFYIGIAPQGAASASMGQYRWEKWNTPAYHERLKQSYYIVQDTFGAIAPAQAVRRTPFEVFWAKWNETSFSRIATWFPIQPILNYMIMFLLSIIVYFFLVLLYIHMVSAVRERAKKKIKAKILGAVYQFQSSGQALSLSSVVNPRMLFSHNGLGIVNELLLEMSEERRQTFRMLCCTRFFKRNIEKRLKTRNVLDLILVIRLVGELRLHDFGTNVKRIMYNRKADLDLQYQGFLTLSLLACRDEMVDICMDHSYVHNLSFRSLQEVLKAYTGDKRDLYRALLGSPDSFVRRICIKRIGIEQCSEFSEDICAFVDSPDYNTVIDAVRTLGQLKYRPAAVRIKALITDSRWEVRSIAVSALGDIDLQTYADIIALSLHDGEWQVRQKAAKALIASPNAEDILVKVKATGDRYAFEILDYMIRNARLREKAS